MSPRVAAQPAQAGSLGADSARVAARASHMMGPAAERQWPPEQAIAWEGLLEVSRRMRRGAEELLLKISRALQYEQLTTENAALRRALERRLTHHVYGAEGG